MKLPKLCYVGEKINFVLDALKGKSVLHLGCVDFRIDDVIKNGTHIHLRLGDITKELYGVDYDQDGIEYLQKTYAVKNLFFGNVENLESLLIDKKFEVVFAGELIEHLSNPGMFLNGVKGFLARDGRLLITTPNAYSIKTYLHLLSGYEQIETDHKLIFSISTIYKLLESHGFQVTDWFMASETQRTKRSSITTPFFGFLYRLFPQYSDKLIVIAKVAQ